MAQALTEQESRYYVSYTRREILVTLLIGALVGFVVWALAQILNKTIFTPLMCNVGSTSKCGMSFEYAAITAQLIAAVIGLVALVRQLTYRPLLIVIASTAALWGAVTMMSAWPWYAALPATIVLYGLAYGLFMLVARIRVLLLSMLALIVLAVVVRLTLNS